MTYPSSSPPSSSFALPFSLVESVLNNHIPPENLPPSIASETPLPNREALLTALTQTDTAINAVEVFHVMCNQADLQDQIAQFYFRNGTFAREMDGLRNLNDGVDWFTEVRGQALQNGKEAIVIFIPRALLILDWGKEVYYEERRVGYPVDREKYYNCNFGHLEYITQDICIIRRNGEVHDICRG
jgi:hypothetical protein